MVVTRRECTAFNIVELEDIQDKSCAAFSAKWMKCVKILGFGYENHWLTV